MVSTPPPFPDVLLIEDDPVVTKLVIHYLRPAKYRVKSFRSAKEFYQSQIPEHPCCLLLDIHLGEPPDGPAIYRNLLRDGVRIPVIFLSGVAKLPLAVDMLRAGALNFLEKDEVVQNPDLLVRAVAEAIQLSARIYQEDRRTADQKALLSKLTPRELETLEWVITGMLNKQIALYLNIKERTVKAHRAKITEKTGLYSVAELVRFAENCGVRPGQIAG